MSNHIFREAFDAYEAWRAAKFKSDWTFAFADCYAAARAWVRFQSLFLAMGGSFKAPQSPTISFRSRAGFQTLEVPSDCDNLNADYRLLARRTFNDRLLASTLDLCRTYKGRACSSTVVPATISAIHVVDDFVIELLLSYFTDDQSI